MNQKAKERADDGHLAPARGAAQTPMIKGHQKPREVARSHLVNARESQLLNLIAKHRFARTEVLLSRV